MNDNPKILNAQIKNVSVYYENHGILTFSIAVDISDGTACVIGGYALDEYNKNTKERQCCAYCLDLLTRIKKVVGVIKWEDCKGKYIRVVSNGLDRSITKIGNLMKDEWLDIPEFIEEYGIK